jgi:NADH-quinone oxidoreductase subunit J
MNVAFYIASVIAIFATVMVITRLNAVHALLYLIVSLLAVSVLFFLLGALFIAALEVIIYAGAIMVLFVFVIMMLNLGNESRMKEKEWFSIKAWILPGILSLILLIEIIYILMNSVDRVENLSMIDPAEIGLSLFRPYVLAVELAAMVLMAAIIGSYHIGKVNKNEYHRFLKKEI